MKRKWRLVLLAAWILMLMAFPVRSELPPIAIMQSYEGQTSNNDIFVFNFELMIQNPTDLPLYNVVIYTDPAMWLPILEPAIYTLGDLAPHEIRNITLSIRTDILLAEELLREHPFTWFGEYADINGNQFTKQIVGVQKLGGGAQ